MRQFWSEHTDIDSYKNREQFIEMIYQIGNETIESHTKRKWEQSSFFPYDNRYYSVLNECVICDGGCGGGGSVYKLPIENWKRFIVNCVCVRHNLWSSLYVWSYISMSFRSGIGQKRLDLMMFFCSNVVVAQLICCRKADVVYADDTENLSKIA